VDRTVRCVPGGGLPKRAALERAVLAAYERADDLAGTAEEVLERLLEPNRERAG